MGPSVYVKVVGFRDVERHALNTVFRLSMTRSISYGLWTPDAPVSPRLVLMDLDSPEAALELDAPHLGVQPMMICIGAGAPARANRAFERPLHWPDVVSAMDSLFSTDQAPDAVATQFDDIIESDPPPAIKVVLLIDPNKEDRLYLRARLALGNLTEVDDASTAAQALDWAKKRHYDLVILSLDVPDMEGWELIRQLVTLEPAIGRIVVTSKDKSWHMREHAENSGCWGLLEKPFDPVQIIELLQKI